jgi:hypothetical protein
MSTTTILAPMTAAGFSQQFSSNGVGSFNLTGIGLSGVETATLRFYDPVSATWANLERNGQTYAVMSSGNNNINIILENGLYCVQKTATGVAVGIGITTQPYQVIFNGQVGA